MELEKFNEILAIFCERFSGVTPGKMMSSPAIHWNGKVFAFFSRKKKMVFKLGKNFDITGSSEPLSEFNPFKNKGPLSGWYELDFEHHEKWAQFTELALHQMKSK